MTINRDTGLVANVVMVPIQRLKVEEHVLIMVVLDIGNILMVPLNQREDVIRMKSSNFIKVFVTVLFLICIFLGYENYKLENNVNKMQVENNQRVDSLKTKIHNLQSQIDDNEGKISDVESKADDVEDRVSNLEDYLNYY